MRGVCPGVGCLPRGVCSLVSAQRGGCLGGRSLTRGGVSAQGAGWLPRGFLIGVSAWGGVHLPPVDRILDTRFRKHYLSATSFADRNKQCSKQTSACESIDTGPNSNQSKSKIGNASMRFTHEHVPKTGGVHCTYDCLTALFTKPAVSRFRSFHDFDWYNSCGTEKCPLAVNGSPWKEWSLGGIPASSFLGNGW